MVINNPFATNGYVQPAYLYYREKKTEKIVSLLINENNVALISPRRIGKTDLLFQPSEIKDRYHIKFKTSSSNFGSLFTIYWGLYKRYLKDV